MRLLTWNCCRGALDKKLSAIVEQHHDVAVIQECARPAAESSQCVWIGDNPRQGMAVLTTGEYTVLKLEQVPGVPRYMFPVRVEGPQSFNLLAVWSKGGQDFPYIEGVVRGVDVYRPLFSAGPTLLAGDLNSNVIWNDEHPADANHSALIDKLDELGLTSCYHHFYNETPGKESRATYYFHWKRERPFHIDYCFSPKAWAKCISAVEVGAYESCHGFSDHRPLLVDFAL
jgi:hypothetical protein